MGRQAAAYLVRGDKGEIERRCSGDIGVDRLLLTWLGSGAGFGFGFDFASAVGFGSGSGFGRFGSA